MRVLGVILFIFTSVRSLTDWQLLGHNNFRFQFKGTTTTWKVSNTHAQSFHLTRWDVPFGASQNQNGGIAQRTDDGHVFIQLLGTDAEQMGDGIGAEKRHGPPFVWEIDGETGATIRMYNLSSAGKVFESPLRFTPAGNPMVAVQKGGGYHILVLDRNSDQILTNIGSPIEPLLLFPTNTNPPSVVMASMYQIATINFDSTGKTLDPSTKKTSSAISTVIFGVDGQTMYNGAVSEESTGMYRYKLPIHGGGAHKMTSGISPYPWQTVNDGQGNVYGVYGGHTKAFNSSGHQQWATPSPGTWMAMSDDEKLAISGDGRTIAVMDAATGRTEYAPIVLATDLKQPSDTKLQCYYSEQPWAPRHPLVLADGRMAVLCRNQDGYFVSTFDLATGKISMNRAHFNLSGINVLTGDANSNVYAYGFENSLPTVQRIHV